MSVEQIEDLAFKNVHIQLHIKNVCLICMCNYYHHECKSTSQVKILKSAQVPFIFSRTLDIKGLSTFETVQWHGCSTAAVPL